MPRFAAALMIAGGSLAFAQTFAFEIGSPVASQDFRFKSAAFVFRTTGCADPATLKVTASAEGLDKGTRQSKSLAVAKSSRPGIFAVTEEWSPGGNWVVSMKGTCGDAIAGVIIPIGRNGFVRDAAKFFSRPPTSAEIDAALKAFPEGGYK